MKKAIKDIFSMIKEDIEDFCMICRCAFAIDDNPVTIVNHLKKEREDRMFNELFEQQRKSIESDHEPEEVKECMRYAYSSFLRDKARVLCYDFSEPFMDSKDYLQYHFQRWKDGKISEFEYKYKRAHYKMKMTNFFMRFAVFVVGCIISVVCFLSAIVVIICK